MAAEPNVIKKAQMAKVREMDFALKFGENVQNLITMLGITRKIPVTAGTALKVLKTTGTLQSGIVAEGDIIPLSQYETSYETVGEATLNKWRKGTTAEAILKGGYDQAVNGTDAKMVLDIQKSIRSQFVNFLGTGSGSASGATLQPALANAWGKLQVLFEDDAVQTVFLMNPMDVSDYLGSANITTQEAFGLKYVQNFLGLGTLIITGAVPAGTFYATASENIVLYYVNVSEANGLGEVFEFTTDTATGLIGIHESADYERLQEETVAICGVTLLAERLDGVIVGLIGNNTLKPVGLSILPGSDSVYGVNVSDIQDGVSISGSQVSGSLKFLSGSNPITDEWGEGNFLAVTFTADNWSDYTSVKVGLEPTQGSGYAELIGHLDDLKSTFKIGNDVTQKLKIIATNGTLTRTEVFDLSGLTLEDGGEG